MKSSILCLFLSLSLLACSEAAKEASEPKEKSVEFNANNVLGSGLSVRMTFQDSRSETIEIENSGRHRFSSNLIQGDVYNLSINSQPSNPNQTCSFNKSSGEIIPAQELNLELNCVTVQYELGGTLLANPNRFDEIVLSVNDKNIQISSLNNNNFIFDSVFDDGSDIHISVLSSPNSYTCQINGLSELIVKINGQNNLDLTLSCVFNGFLPMNFTIKKTDSFTTPPISNYLNDFEPTNAAPIITDWNIQKTAELVDVEYDSAKGNFILTPSNGISGGVDSFSFKVTNSVGDTEIHFFTIDIERGWNPIDLQIPTSTFAVPTASTVNLNNNPFYHFSDIDIGREFAKLSEQQHTLSLSSNKPNVTRNVYNLAHVIDHHSGSNKLFYINNDSSNVVLGFYEHDSSTNSYGAFQEIRHFTDMTVRFSVDPIIDNSGNTLIILALTDSTNVTTLKSIYFSPLSGWGSLVDIDGYSHVHIVNGVPVIVLQSQNASPILKIFDLENEIWLTRELVSGEPQPNRTSRLYSEANNDNDIYVEWQQTSSSDNSKLRLANVYMIDEDRQLGHQILSRFPQNGPTSSSTSFKINDFDFVTLELISETINQENLTSIISHEYSARGEVLKSVNVSSQQLPGDHRTLYAKLDQNSGSLIYTWKTGTRLFNHFYVLRFADGTWYSPNAVNIEPTSQRTLTNTFDKNGNLIVVYDELENSTVVYRVIRHDRNGASLPVTLGPANEFQSHPQVTTTLTDKTFIHWNAINGNSQMDLCYREILEQTVFDITSLTDMECVGFDLPDASKMQFEVFSNLFGEEYLVTTYMRSEYGNIYSATKSDDLWQNQRILHTALRTNASYDTRLLFFQYGENNEYLSVMVEQIEALFTRDLTHYSTNIMAFSFN